MKALTAFGTFPEAAKMAQFVNALATNPSIDGKVWVIIRNHRMINQVLELLEYSK